MTALSASVPVSMWSGVISPRHYSYFSGLHNALDQTALELRTNRLREIKQELSKILNRPDDPKVWWERSRRPQQPA